MHMTPDTQLLRATSRFTAAGAAVTREEAQRRDWAAAQQKNTRSAKTNMGWLAALLGARRRPVLR